MFNQPYFPDQPVNISNPSIPFNAAITPKPGRLFTINGIAFNECPRFSVNFFVNGSDGDCGLHIDFRFDQNVVVRNSRISGNWELEERTSGLPINRGVPFEMMVLVERCRFMIACNGRHFAEFTHRIPLSLINTLNIQGQVSVSMYRETTANAALNFPLPLPMNPRYVAIDKTHVYDIHGGFMSGRTMHIMGRSRKGTIIIDFVERDNSDDIGLHISCRVGEGVIALNSKRGSLWEAEMRHPNFKLNPSQHFLLEIQSHPREYRLLINGVSSAAFPVRAMSPESIRVVRVGGDIDHRFTACT